MFTSPSCQPCRWYVHSRGPGPISVEQMTLKFWIWHLRRPCFNRINPIDYSCLKPPRETSVDRLIIPSLHCHYLFSDRSEKVSRWTNLAISTVQWWLRHSVMNIFAVNSSALDTNRQIKTRSQRTTTLWNSMMICTFPLKAAEYMTKWKGPIQLSRIHGDDKVGIGRRTSSALPSLECCCLSAQLL